MKIKLQEIINLREFCSRVKNELVDMELAYKLYQLSKITNENVDFYNNKMKELLLKYCEKEDDGTIKQINDNFVIMPNYSQEFAKAVYDLQNLEIEIIDIKFTLDNFNTLKLSSSDINNLINFIEK